VTQYFEQANKLIQSKTSFTSVTILSIEGSAPQDVGAKMIVTTNGLYFGTVGGGKIEAFSIKFATKYLLEKKKFSILEKIYESQSPSIQVTWNLQKDIGMTCGGRVSLLFEKYNYNQWSVAIFGAGHVAQALCDILQYHQAKVIVFDNRQDWLNKICLSLNIETKYSKNMSLEIDKLESLSQIIIMTQGHTVDVPILIEALNKNIFPFVGVIGSNSKRKQLIKELTDKNVTTEFCENFFCPIGKKIGNNSPQEIAISILSQLIEERDIYNNE